MARSLQPSTFIPAGLVLVEAKIEGGVAVISVRARPPMAGRCRSAVQAPSASGHG